MSQLKERCENRRQKNRPWALLVRTWSTPPPRGGSWRSTQRLDLEGTTPSDWRAPESDSTLQIRGPDLPLKLPGWPPWPSPEQRGVADPEMHTSDVHLGREDGGPQPGVAGDQCSVGGGGQSRVCEVMASF
jgi:hypothetical protein